MNLLNNLYEVLIHIIVIIFIEIIIFFFIFKKILEKSLEFQNNYELYSLITNNQIIDNTLRGFYLNKNDQNIIPYIDHFHKIENEKIKYVNLNVIYFAILLELILFIILLIIIIISKYSKIKLKFNYLKSISTLGFILVVESLFVFKLNLLLKENRIELFLTLLKEFKKLLKSNSIRNH